MKKTFPSDLMAERRTLLYAIAIVIAPICAVILLASIVIRDNAERLSVLQTQNTLADASLAASRIITELQRERGMSSGFIGSAGQEFGAALKGQRAATDDAVFDSLSHLREEAFPNRSVRGAVGIKGDLTNQIWTSLNLADVIAQDIPAMRQRVDALDVARPDMMTFYTDKIGTLLAVTDLPAVAGTISEKDRLGQTINLIEEAVEFLGRERAAGANGFASDAFDLAKQLEMAEMQASQTTLFSRFQRLSSPIYAEELQSILSGNDGQRLDDLRRQAQNGNANAATGPEWFGAATAVIDGLMTFSNDLRLAQKAAIAASRADITRRYWQTVAITGTALLLSLLMAIWQSRSFVSPLRDLATSLRRVCDGDTQIEVRGRDRRDLVGVLARSVGQIVEMGSRRFHDVLDAAPIATCVESVDGSMYRQNAAMSRLLGIDHDVDPRVPPTAYMDDAHQAGERAAVSLLVNGQHARSSGEVTLHRPDGKVVLGLISRSYLPGAGSTPACVISQIMDMTEARKLDIVKSNFVSTISHELRTPLTSVRGAVGMIRAKANWAPESLEYRLIEIAQSNCERLLALINDLLDMDRLAQGGVTLEIKRHDIAALCAQTIRKLEPYTSNLKVNVLPLATSRAFHARTDAGRFVQVLSNLISNAAKFSPTGSDIALNVKAVGPTIRISVTDKGPGIPIDFVEHVYTRFRQQDGSTSRNFGGSGIGLHIAKGLVELLGGEIGFFNNPAGGATFWFTIPAMGIQASAHDTGESHAEPQTPGLPRILHVEDDPAFSHLLSLAMTDRATVMTALSVCDAKSKLAKYQFDLIVLDLELPDGAGLEILKEDAVAGSCVPVICLSAHLTDAPSSRSRLNIQKSGTPFEDICDAILTTLAAHSGDEVRI
ncbi:nitrate- and nitrite sensing domain-containing protein [Loktanella sp. M215]|uniref:nitrate- and nitrite sensing domain-containing protein n=1 Tax=Loktanella sp. M215 TaxID=2675431 RepID=UPI001F27FA85|nr:nitrate- and nitrite sensing domain-containing protein [Loktanella sp. M215]MCF7698927.1 response regulator [Loktanella sp. M215]